MPKKTAMVFGIATILIAYTSTVALSNQAFALAGTGGQGGVGQILSGSHPGLGNNELASVDEFKDN